MSYYYNLRKSRFIKDLSIVAGGTATAQIITVAFSPIITRLYGPEAFGLLGVFNSAVTIIVPIASLTYVHAIVLPETDQDAKSLVRLAFFITAGIFIVSLLIIFPFHQQIAYMIGFDAAAIYLLLIPLVIVMGSSEKILREWLIRKKQFKSISGVAVAQAAITGTLKSGVGYFYAAAPVLLVLNAISYFLHTFLLWLRATPSLFMDKQDNVENVPAAKKSINEVAYNYRDFPIFRSPQVFFNSLSQNLPTLMLAALFGPVQAGFYAISLGVLKLPSIFISKSVGTVFLPRIAEAANRRELLQPYLLKATGGLALLGIIPFGIIIIFGPWLFGLVFGSEWVTAGVYSRWLSLWLYFMFTNIASVQAVPLLGAQKQILIHSVLTTALRVGALLFAAVFLKNDIWAIILFSLVGAMANITLIVWVLFLSGKMLREGMGEKMIKK